MNVSRIDVVRAWKDPEYREGLSEAERAALPANPAGLMDLADAELAGAAGGAVLAGGAGGLLQIAQHSFVDTKCCCPRNFTILRTCLWCASGVPSGGDA